MKISDVSPARTYFESINLASARAANLCKQMLAYSGKGRFVIQLIDLSEVVEEMGHMLKVAVTKKAIIQYDLAEGMPAIEADITQIQQIIMNLIMNASEAIGDKSGSIYLKTCMVDCDMRYLKEARFTNDLDAGRYVCLEVSDTGSGMDKETLSRIFDPFFTTKFIGRGLGLSAVLGIVTGHKGAIKVYSELGKGTTFRLLFPAVKREVSAGPEDFVQYSERLTGRGIVLLVDDEDAIRSIGRSILEGMGYNVLLAANGKEAIEIFKANLGNIACVILDLTMPAMDGEETFREMRINSEEIPIIMSSGYNQQEVVNRFIGKNLSGFIQKPYSIKSLKEVLRKVLGGR
jgi:CheY-like chemotaxis protein